MCLTFIRKPSQMKAFTYKDITFNTTLDDLGNVLVEASKINIICGLCTNAIELRASYRNINNIFKCRFYNTYYSGTARIVTKRFIPVSVLMNIFYTQAELSFAQFISNTVVPYWENLPTEEKDFSHQSSYVEPAWSVPIETPVEDEVKPVQPAGKAVDEVPHYEGSVTLTDKLNEAMKLVDGFYECANNMNELLKKIKAL